MGFIRSVCAALVLGSIASSPAIGAPTYKQLTPAEESQLQEQIKGFLENKEWQRAEGIVSSAGNLSPECQKRLLGYQPGQTGEKSPGGWVRQSGQDPHRSHDDRLKSDDLSNGAWKPEWEKIVTDAISGQYPELLATSNAEMAGVCSGFSELQQDQKVKFWGAWFEALARAESDLDPKDYSPESFKADNGSNQVSIGLLQMSMDDKKAGCEFTSEESIKDPKLNLECGIRKTMQLLMSSDNSKYGEQTLLHRGSAYWHVLREKEKDNSENKRYKAFRTALTNALSKRGVSCAESTF